MVEVTRYRPGDRGEVVALYARVFGAEAAGAFERRWDWMYGLNPNRPGGEPLIWLAREGGAIVGQYATMPVTLSVDGTEIDAAWGMDVMIAPEQQRRGLGNLLFATWDRHVGASIGLGLTDGSHALFTKLHWPDLGRVPRYVMPLSRRVLVDWGARRWGREVATLPWRRLVARVRPLGGEIRRISRFDEGVTRLWERVGRKFAFVVRRDAPYLNWKFAESPHLPYEIATLVRDGEVAGYAVLRHVTEARYRTTLLVDFLADPDDARALPVLLRWVAREAMGAGADLIRTCTTHAGYGAALRQAGFRLRKPAARFVARINAVPVSPGFYASVDRWHVTLGDSDVDR